MFVLSVDTALCVGCGKCEEKHIPGLFKLLNDRDQRVLTEKEYHANINGIDMAIPCCPESALSITPAGFMTDEQRESIS